MKDRPEVPTRVAHAGFDEHRFRGRRLFADLLGRTDYWSLVSIALGGPALDADASQDLNDLAVAGTVADPRIWPLKAVRLVAAAHGRAPQALAAGQLFMSDGNVGAAAIGRAAGWLAGLVRGGGGDPDALARARDRAARGERLAGFGTPYRAGDERVIALRARLGARGRLDRPHHLALCAVEEAFAAKGVAVNYGGLMAAVCLDDGLAPELVAGLAIFTLLPALAANAWEGAAEPAESLRRLPSEWIEYRGPGPRASPRSQAAR